MNDQIKLIQIYKRRLAKLREQLARVGAQREVTVDLEIEDIEASIKDIETQLRRRRQSLLEKLAIYGISADPHITMEIEDINKYFDNL